MEDIFSIKRAISLCWRQLFLNKNILLISWGAATGLLLFITVLTAHYNPENLYGLNSLNLVVMFLGGVIFSSNAFSELQNKEKAMHYLTLPVSNIERMISAWVLTSPFYAIISIITIFAINTTGLLFASTSLNFTAYMGHIFNSNFWIVIAIYLSTQTIFFLGAVAFHKNNLMKTLLFIFVLQLGLSIFSVLVGILIFWIGNGFQWPVGECNFHGTHFSPSLLIIFKWISKTILWIVLPIFLLIVSFFKLKERQL